MLNVAYRVARRIAITIVGFTVLAIGIAMIALPGPAFIALLAARSPLLWVTFGVLPILITWPIVGVVWLAIARSRRPPAGKG